ncbi:uncharacterized protein VTP21DRAFT_556 [Calcarisporiella thermophila]|uniref:uncharacterized protein n=1 Tax=Calcarisporiella thermophila TaxID=911321 RepID=UPI0037442BAD
MKSVRMTKDSTTSGGVKRNLLIFLAAALVRLILFRIPAVTDTLVTRVETTTPLTSYKRLCEGVYLFQHGLPPYDGGIFHHPPLFLPLFQIFLQLPQFFTHLIYIVADLAIAYGLSEVTRRKQQIYSNKKALDEERGKAEITPFSVAALYLFNPLTIASCVSKSTVIFSNAAIVGAVVYATKAEISLSMFWLAAASYHSFYPIMLVVPLVMLISSQRSEWRRTAVESAGFLAIWLSALLGLSYLLVGSWDFIHSTYGLILSVSDLTPNVGLFWYFFIEMFDQFRTFFLVVFQLHAFTFTVPFSIKFSEHPLFVVFLLTTVMALFKSYPSIGDAALYMGFFPIYHEIFKYIRLGFLSANLYLYAAALSPVFWYLWVWAGTGNANFFYAVTLVYNSAQVVLLVDAVFAFLRREYDLEHPEARGKEIIQK